MSWPRFFCNILPSCRLPEPHAIEPLASIRTAASSAVQEKIPACPLDKNPSIWIITRILCSLKIRLCGGACQGPPRKPGRTRQLPRLRGLRTRTRNSPFPTTQSSGRPRNSISRLECHDDFVKDESAR